MLIVTIMYMLELTYLHMLLFNHIQRTRNTFLGVFLQLQIIAGSDYCNSVCILYDFFPTHLHTHTGIQRHMYVHEDAHSYNGINIKHTWVIYSIICKLPI